MFSISTVILMNGECVMAHEREGITSRPGEFSLSWSGGREYGSRELSFDGEGKFYFAKGDTINSQTQTGVGVFVLDVQKADLPELKAVAEALCDRNIQSGGRETVDPPATFGVTCLEDGKIVSKGGSMRLIPEEFNRRIFDAPFRLAEQAWAEGRKLIKLDFSPYKVEHTKDGFIVSVRFVNSGDRWIKFKTPDQWGGNYIEGRLGVGAVRKIHKNGVREDVRKSWGFPLGGQKLLNRDEFKDGVVILNPGDSKILKFRTTPNYKALKGEYEFSGIAFMNIEYEGYGWGLSTHVDFGAMNSRITVDRDYPLTPEEREQWEAKHRADLSLDPVKPGKTFAEDGLYRAERLISDGTYRSLQVRPFKAGDIATTDAVKMPMESGDGVNINGPVQWVWEGRAPQPVKPFATEYVEGTQHHAAPGTSCPRSGRWLARIFSGRNALYPDYHYDLLNIVTLKRGQKMPPIQNKGAKADWEWVGA
jgi:hypothetical protein